MSPPLQFTDFESAGRGVLAYLQQRLGFDLWMVTRALGDDWIVLQARDRGYGVEPGTVYRWADSLCSRMVDARGPRVAPLSLRVPAYAEAPIARRVPIQAYIGVPLLRSDGSLFGTLCAFDPQPQPESIAADQALVELLAALLGAVLQADLRAASETRRAETLKAQALNDALTNLYNRRAWDSLMAYEEERCRRYGHPAAVLVVDLDRLKRVNDEQGHAAGDALLQRASHALRNAARAVDVVARLGGDEFGIISMECDAAGAAALLGRVRTALAGAGVEASVGLAVRTPSIGLKGTWESADRLMMDDKRMR